MNISIQIGQENSGDRLLNVSKHSVYKIFAHALHTILGLKTVLKQALWMVTMVKVGFNRTQIWPKHVTERLSYLWRACHRIYYRTWHGWAYLCHKMKWRFVFHFLAIHHIQNSSSFLFTQGVDDAQKYNAHFRVIPYNTDHTPSVTKEPLSCNLWS